MVISKSKNSKFAFLKLSFWIFLQGQENPRKWIFKNAKSSKMGTRGNLFMLSLVVVTGTEDFILAVALPPLYSVHWTGLIKVR